jgi:protocatechuate 3,4-dioxygenase beta subunit
VSRTNRILLPLLLIPLTLGEMAGQDPPPWDPTLTGTTIDAGTGRPIPGVALHLVPAETGVASPPPTVTDFPLRAISDAEGRFVIEAARPGRYRLAPVLDGYVYARPEHLEAPVAPGLVLQIEPRQPMDGLEVALVPEAIITGQVFRPNGSPHSNTRVRLFRNGYDDQGRQTPVDVPGVSSVRTDDRGEYRFFGLQPGE